MIMLASLIYGENRNTSAISEANQFAFAIVVVSQIFPSERNMVPKFYERTCVAPLSTSSLYRCPILAWY